LKKRKRGWTDHENNCDHLLQKSEKEELPPLEDFVSGDLDNGSGNAFHLEFCLNLKLTRNLQVPSILLFHG
jgi:hypothetical protein